MLGRMDRALVLSTVHGGSLGEVVVVCSQAHTKTLCYNARLQRVVICLAESTSIHKPSMVLRCAGRLSRT